MLERRLPESNRCTGFRSPAQATPRNRTVEHKSADCRGKASTVHPADAHRIPLFQGVTRAQLARTCRGAHLELRGVRAPRKSERPSRGHASDELQLQPGSCTPGRGRGHISGRGSQGVLACRPRGGATVERDPRGRRGRAPARVYRRWRAPRRRPRPQSARAGVERVLRGIRRELYRDRDAELIGASPEHCPRRRVRASCASAAACPR
jgi:hypothetical protein